MIKKKTFFIILIIAIIFSLPLLSGCLKNREVFTHDDLKRTYILHLPSNFSSDNTYPLVLVFHGGGGNAENIADTTNFSQKADEEDFIVVYPDGTGKLKQRLLTWNAGFCCGYALENDIDDVDYIKSLITHLQTQYPINESMIYATGLSNGGIMTYRLGAELSTIFAAIAPVAAQIGGQPSVEEELWCIPEPTNPVSVLAFHGTNDRRVPYDGGRPSDNDTAVYSWMSTNESIQFWVDQNQCNSFPKRNINSSKNIIIDTYLCGKNNTEVQLVTIVNGTHSWPGGEKGWKNGAEPTKEINATNLIWEFFENHPKTR